MSREVGIDLRRRVDRRSHHLEKKKKRVMLCISVFYSYEQEIKIVMDKIVIVTYCGLVIIYFEQKDIVVVAESKIFWAHSFSATKS